MHSGKDDNGKSADLILHNVPKEEMYEHHSQKLASTANPLVTDGEICKKCHHADDFQFCHAE